MDSETTRIMKSRQTDTLDNECITDSDLYTEIARLYKEYEFLVITNEQENEIYV